jgi:hypothetical protein
MAYSSVLSQCAGRDSIPDSLCAMVSGMESRPAKLLLFGFIEKLRSNLLHSC